VQQRVFRSVREPCFTQDHPGCSPPRAWPFSRASREVRRAGARWARAMIVAAHADPIGPAFFRILLEADQIRDLTAV